MLSSQILKILVYYCVSSIGIGFYLISIWGVVAVAFVVLPLLVPIILQDIFYYSKYIILQQVRLYYYLLRFIFSITELSLLISAYVFISIFLCFYFNFAWNIAIEYSFIITIYVYYCIVIKKYYEIKADSYLYILEKKCNFRWIFSIIFYIFILIIPFFFLIYNFYHYESQCNDYILYMDSSGGGNPDPDPSWGTSGGGTGGTGPPDPDPNKTIEQSVYEEDPSYKKYTKRRALSFKEYRTVILDDPESNSEYIRSFKKFPNEGMAKKHDDLKNIAFVKNRKYHILLRENEVTRFKDIGHNFSRYNPFSYESISSSLKLTYERNFDGAQIYSGEIYGNKYEIYLNKDNKFREALVESSAKNREAFEESSTKNIEAFEKSYNKHFFHFKREEDFVTWWRTGGEIRVNKYSTFTEPFPYSACKKAFFVKEIQESAKDIVARERGFNK